MSFSPAGDPRGFFFLLKKILEINEGLHLGSVHKPLTGICEDDLPKIEKTAQHIREAIARFC